MRNIFRPLDPRLVAELKTQRRPIAAGLVCVVITALLTAATIFLIERSVRAIQNAAQRTEQNLFSAREVTQISERLDRPREQVERALDAVATDRLRDGHLLTPSEATEFSQRLGVDPIEAEAALRTATEERAASMESPDDAIRTLGWVSLLIVGVYIVKYWFTRGQVYYLSKAAARLASNLRIRLFTKLQRLPISYFNEKRSGAIHSVLTNDVTVYQNAVTIVRDSIDAPIRALGSFTIIVWLQWQLALVAILFTPVMAFAIQRNARKMKAAQAQVQQDLSNLGAMTHEALQGTRVVRGFAAEDRVAKQYEGLVEASYKSQMSAVRRLASLRPLVEVIGAAALAAVLYICGWLAKEGSLQLSHIAALIYALDVINQGFRGLGYVNNTYAQVQAAAERIYSEVLDVPERQVDEPGALELPSPQGRIEFRNVSFVYPDGTQALKEVSFTLEPGTSLALVGPSGAGKSTIADLMLRFYDPTSGSILFDGVDIRELKVSWLRNQIGVVPQQTFLFAGSISENIRLGAPHASQEEIEEAAKAAYADQFIEQMPSSYETELGERGVRLSGGEMQRVAIARALVRRPTLLLLDEATSNLDAVSEKAVQQALDKIMRERTTLFIAHRLTTAARADQILVLSRGEVLESGSHQSLMEMNGSYAAMYKAFTSGVLDGAVV